jgi:hypothetical protein
MKNGIIVLFLTLCFLSSKGQILYGGTGTTISKLNFKNSEGAKLEGVRGSNKGTFCIGVRYPLFQTAFHVSAEASLQHYYAQASDPVLRNYYAWDGSFASGGILFDYEFFKPLFAYYQKSGFSVSLKALMNAEFLTGGYQNINDQLTALRKAPEFEEPFYFVGGGVSANYYFNKFFYANLQYLYRKTILIDDYSGKQQVGFVTHSITIGGGYNFGMLSNKNK